MPVPIGLFYYHLPSLHLLYLMCVNEWGYSGRFDKTPCILLYVDEWGYSGRFDKTPCILLYVDEWGYSGRFDKTPCISS